MRTPTYKVAVTVVYVMGLFIQILDATIINVALPTLSRQFDVPITSVDWVVTAYLLALASGIPASGWLADRFGSKRTFLGALSVFTAASALCGLAGSLDQLVLFRVLQGLGAGLITPVGSAILFRAYPLQERAKAATAVVGVAVIAPSIGPVLGGVIVDNLSWRWIFLVNLPIGIAALILGSKWLREHTEPDAGRFDAAGLVLSGSGLAMLLYGLSLGPDNGWADPKTLGFLLGSVAAFVVLITVELRIAQPILHLQLYRERLFRTTNLAGLSIYAGFLGQIFVFTLYLQNLRGTSASIAGLTQSPQAVGVFFLSMIAGRRLYRVVGPRPMMVVGSLGTGLVTGAFALTNVTTPLLVLGAMNFVRGLFIGLVFVSIQTAVYARISNADTAKATTLFSVQRQSANALGVALMATVLSALLPAKGVDPVLAASEGLAAYRAAFLWCAALFIPGVYFSFRIVNHDAVATREPAPTAKR